MRTEYRQILIECLRRQTAIEAAEPPPEWRHWDVNEHNAALAHGPRYLPSEWFGAMTNAQRQHYMRGVYVLADQGLLTAYKTAGRRLQRVKLTEAGIIAGRQLAAQEAASDA